MRENNGLKEHMNCTSSTDLCILLGWFKKTSQNQFFLLHLKI